MIISNQQVTIIHAAVQTLMVSASAETVFIVVETMQRYVLVLKDQKKFVNFVRK